MLIPASVEDVQAHIQSAVDLTHPLHKHGSRLPPDVRDAVLWVVQRGTSVAAERTTRLQQLASIQSSLDGWDSYLWKEGVPEHVKAMIAYKPRLAFLHALVIALKWPFQDLVLNMAAGFAPVGMQPDTGIWCLDPPENQPECFERLKEDDLGWNDRLFSSMVRAAQASPDHGFCGVRARAGDHSYLELR